MKFTNINAFLIHVMGQNRIRTVSLPGRYRIGYMFISALTLVNFMVNDYCDFDSPVAHTNFILYTRYFSTQLLNYLVNSARIEQIRHNYTIFT